MIVVSNTSPVTNLSAVGQLDLLPRLFGEMHLPRAVEEELSAGGFYLSQPVYDHALEVAGES
jgi:predicted nucleic acid-binding protein